MFVYAFDHISLNTHRIAFGLKSKRAIKINVSAHIGNGGIDVRWESNANAFHSTLTSLRSLCVFFSFAKCHQWIVARECAHTTHKLCMPVTRRNDAGDDGWDATRHKATVTRHPAALRLRNLFALIPTIQCVCVCRCRCECCVYAVSMCLIIFNVVQ